MNTRESVTLILAVLAVALVAAYCNQPSVVLPVAEPTATVRPPTATLVPMAVATATLTATSVPPIVVVVPATSTVTVTATPAVLPVLAPTLAPPPTAVEGQGAPAQIPRERTVP